MGVSVSTRQAYSEIDEFLSLLSLEQKNKVPQKLREVFAQEKDQNYIKKINPTIPIKEQGLKEETLAIIALLNLKYWCEDEVEKQRLIKIYEKNEKEYQEILREKFNPDNIFNHKIDNEESQQGHIENTQIVVYKESILKKMIDRILKILWKIKKN